MNEIEIFFYGMMLSVVLNVAFFFVFFRLHSMWHIKGEPNFFMGMVKHAFHRIKGGRVIVAANNSKYAPLYWSGADEPLKSNPSSTAHPALQFEPKNLFYTGKGIPLAFVFEGHLTNSNPLEDSNDDIQLQQIGQATLKHIALEVERSLQHFNPLSMMKKYFLIHGAVMVLGLIVIVVMLMNIQQFTQYAQQAFEAIKPSIDEILKRGGSFSLPAKVDV